MVQYYTLQEAAARLQVTPDLLKEMAKKNEVRAFQDRGNLRFRAQEIDELARSRGHDSDPELQFGDSGAKASEPKSGGPKSGGPKSGRSTKNVSPPTDKDFDLGQNPDSEEVGLGQDPASAGSKNTPRNTSTRSPNPKRSGSSPRPASSDSDVRLVGDGSDLAFQIDSDAKVEKSPSPAPKTPGSGRKSKVDPAPDSGVRIVPLDEASDSDVKMVPDDTDSKVPLGQSKSKTPSDSDIRLEELHSGSGKGKRDEKNLVTEEIDLDAEEMKAALEAKARPKKKMRDSSHEIPKLPTNSPFELSEPDVQLGSRGGSKTGAKRPSKVEREKEKDDKDSSSDFELTPVQDLGSSPLELGSDEMTPIKLDDSDEEEVGLGELTSSGTGRSGINLKDPVDSGISLEQGGSDEMEIELKLEPGKTPKPAQKADSSSEFELSLDDSDAAEEEEGSSSEFELTLDEPSSPTEEGSSSEFELSLDLDESSSVEMENPEGGSDSEFELTIDDAGGLDVDDGAAGEDKDIFETDFEVPALDDESGSEAVALDEEGGESSDFDLDVDDEEADTEAESGSEVVALDEDLDDAPAVAPAKKKKGGRTMVVEEEEGQEPGEFEDLEVDSEAAGETETEAEKEEAEEEEELVAAAPARRSWGVFTPLCATLCAFIMFFVCLMSYEMVAGMFGYHKSTKTSSLILDPLARALFDEGGSFPKD